MDNHNEENHELAVWKQLQFYLQQDQEGRDLLKNLSHNSADLDKWQEWHKNNNSKLPSQLATSISGGNLERLINIGSVGVVVIHPPCPKKNTNKNALIFIIALVAIVGIIGGGCFLLLKNRWTESQNTTSLEGQEFETYTNNSYRFRVKYPLDWLPKEVIDPITKEVITLLPSETSSFAKMQASITVNADARGEKIPLEDYVNKYVINEVRKFGKEAKILNINRNTALGGQSAYKVTYTLIENNATFKRAEFISFKGENVYIVSYSAIENQFYKFEKIAEVIRGSFEFMLNKSSKEQIYDRIGADNSINLSILI